MILFFSSEYSHPFFYHIMIIILVAKVLYYTNGCYITCRECPALTNKKLKVSANDTGKVVLSQCLPKHHAMKTFRGAEKQGKLLAH
jgi:hypothetical protein